MIARSGIAPGDHVQFNLSGAVCCSRVESIWLGPDHVEFAKVRALPPIKVLGIWPTRALRRCSNLDGLCLCAGEAAELENAA